MGEVLDRITVPSWFHAQQIVHAVMTRQQRWRVHPAAGRLPAGLGATRVWMADAPPPDLAALAHQTGIPTTKPGARASAHHLTPQNPPKTQTHKNENRCTTT